MDAFKRYLTEAEQHALLRTLQLHSGDLLARRDGAWIRALLHSGMRLNEFALMSVGDALEALRTRYIFIPQEHRKGWNRRPRKKDGKLRQPPKDHTVLVTAPLEQALRDLLAVRVLMLGCGVSDVSAPLVVSRQGGRMTCRQFEHRMKTWAAAAGLPEATSPHWLRHTRAKNIMRRSTSTDPRGVVQAALGHASIASTGIYTQVSREELEAALEEVDGAGDRRRVKRGLRAGFEGRARA